MVRGKLTSTNFIESNSAGFFDGETAVIGDLCQLKKNKEILLQQHHYIVVKV